MYYNILTLFLFVMLFSSTTLVFTIEDAEAVRATLRCGHGWSASATYELTEDGEPISGPHTQSCPPTSRITSLPAFNDLTIISYSFTSPDGRTTTGPPGGPLPPAPFGPLGGMHPHPACDEPHEPPCPSSYVCNAAGCVPDPAAPAFVQDGEFLLVAYDENSSSNLTVNLRDFTSGLPVSGVLVTAINSTNNIPFDSKVTNSDGKAKLNLDNGGEYYLSVDDVNYWPQVSDTFLIANDHIWTMILTPGVPNAQQTIQDLQNQINDLNTQVTSLQNQLSTGTSNNFLIWILIGLIIGIGIGVGIAIFLLRRRP